MTYQEVLDFLYEQLPMYQKVGKVAFNKDLSKTIELCNVLSNPQNNFKSIHIAGTNGKGSTAHLMASVLQHAGYKVGLYTSPHLKIFRERIRINGEPVSEKYITSFVEQHQAVISKIAPSFFEITVAMAFDYFAQEEVDIAVIETGLGGRLDSTNVINPILSIITSVSLDHQDFLGDSVKSIAKEKAGIIKRKTPVVVGRVSDEVVSVILKVADENNSEYFNSQSYFDVRVEGDEVVGINEKETHKEMLINSELKDTALKYNLPTVITSIEVLKKNGFEIKTEAVRKGIERVCSTTGLKGRWQILEEFPLTICDVGHNEEAVGLSVERILNLGKEDLHIIWGMVGDKSIDKILALLPGNATYYFCAANLPRALSASELMKKANQEGLSGKKYDSVNLAYRAARDNSKPDDLVFIGGSTFVVAELKNL